MSIGCISYAGFGNASPSNLVTGEQEVSWNRVIRAFWSQDQANCKQKVMTNLKSTLACSLSDVIWLQSSFIGVQDLDSLNPFGLLAPQISLCELYLPDSEEARAFFL